MARCKYWKFAKLLLIQNIAGEIIPNYMKVEEVWKLCDEYTKCKLGNFKKNLKSNREHLN